MVMFFKDTPDLVLISLLQLSLWSALLPRNLFDPLGFEKLLFNIHGPAMCKWSYVLYIL